MELNGNGDSPGLSEEEHGRFLIAVDLLRDRVERGERAEVPQPVVDFIAGAACLQAAPFAEEMRERVVEAVARGSSTVLLTVLTAMLAPAK